MKRMPLQTFVCPSCDEESQHRFADPVCVWPECKFTDLIPKVQSTKNVESTAQPWSAAIVTLGASCGLFAIFFCVWQLYEGFWS